MINVIAPETTLTEVKVAASISCCPKASRHSNELAANANMARTVSTTVREPKLSELLDMIPSP